MTNKELREAIRAGYCWPGGYTIFGVCDDGGVLCCHCMRQEYHQIAYARRHKLSNGWQVIDCDTTDNCQKPPTCDHCGGTIE